MYKQGGYEAHMTFDQQYHVDVSRQVESPVMDMFEGFVYSIITGCPLLGKGTYCYLTAYSKDNPDELVKKMKEITSFFDTFPIPTLRAKVEHIVYDTKTGVNELCGNGSSTDFNMPILDGKKLEKHLSDTTS